MNAMTQSDTKVITAELEMNKEMVRQMVLESYEDMTEGKGRRASEFFDELESRYQVARV